MQTLHLKADNSVINELLNIVNKLNKAGKDVEIMDNSTFKIEDNMINQALKEEQDNQVQSHEEVWNKLLKE